MVTDLNLFTIAPAPYVHIFGDKTRVMEQQVLYDQHEEMVRMRLVNSRGVHPHDITTLADDVINATCACVARVGPDKIRSIGALAWTITRCRVANFVNRELRRRNREFSFDDFNDFTEAGAA